MSINSKWKAVIDHRTRREKMLDEFSQDKNVPIWGFFLLLFLYFIGAVLVNGSSTSDQMVFLFGRPMPIRTLTGAFSSLFNLCVILMVVIYKKPGFIVSIVTLIAQYPTLIINLVRGNVNVIPGFFTNSLIIVTIIILYRFIRNKDRYQEKMRNLAITDRLTKLPNRFAASELSDARIKKNEPFGFAIVSLNNFKGISNALGQQTGDQILIQVGKRWQDLADSGKTGTRDFVAFRKNNEFAIIVSDYLSEDELRNTLECYEEALREKLIIDNCDFALSASIGFSSFPEDAYDTETLVNNAYTAMYKAYETTHSGCIVRFTPDIVKNDTSIEIERKIRYALENNQVYFNLQPQFDMNHRLRGFEALARIKDVNGKQINPADFIPVAEKAGLVDSIDREVFSASAKFFGKLLKKTKSDLILSVNVSVHHLLRINFIEELKEILASSEVPAKNLEIEITESVMIESVEKAMDRIKQIKAMGISIAIDDFGTGYSSLSYLSSFPADVLKIDRSFIVNMGSGMAAKSYVAAIIAIGHIMKYKVIAEGVETADQLENLSEAGNDYVQGFLWGRPLEPEEAAKLVSEN